MSSRVCTFLQQASSLVFGGLSFTTGLVGSCVNKARSGYCGPSEKNIQQQHRWVKQTVRDSAFLFTGGCASKVVSGSAGWKTQRSCTANAGTGGSGTSDVFLLVPYWLFLIQIMFVFLNFTELNGTEIVWAKQTLRKGSEAACANVVKTEELYCLQKWWFHLVSITWSTNSLVSGECTFSIFSLTSDHVL